MPPRKPPPAPRKPGRVTVYRAVYAYAAQHADELSFEEGDLIYVQQKQEDGWYRATINGQSGIIPGNYVEADGNAESIDNPLHDAAKRGNLPYLQECLSHGVSVNALDKAGSTPLHWAARGGHVDCVLKLLEQPSVRVDVQNKLGDTALHNAAWKGSPEVVSALLEAGANKALRNSNKETPYDLGKTKNPECGRLLMVRSTQQDHDYGDSADDDEED
eukprot:TRINITY_DN8150_c0_g2_i1.p1 TRINITY_DN8150_c0_g2~~TRINITY_DN8150_c0_g2_i1.p1  ORF type:complete len:217 (+),score=39.20 TRINITY_DN8150_c0_g2_i1:51-701(+)